MVGYCCQGKIPAQEIPVTGTSRRLTYEREGNPKKRLKGKCLLVSFCRFHNDTREGLTQERRIAKR